MNTMFLQVGIFNIALVMTMFCRVNADRKEYQECRFFARLLLATAAILLVDTVGWLIDGRPVKGQIWFTTVIDGLDLLLTTVVCWCWVQYALVIAGEYNRRKKVLHCDFATALLLLQLILVLTSQIFDFYYVVDEAGVYHRAAGYFMHSLISLLLLGYSSGKCIISYRRCTDRKRKNEMLFVTLIILIPILGNVFQLYVYGYPTVWLCMVLMVMIIYIHIQDKRTATERKKHNKILKAALEQAEAANVAKTEFLTRMSHDMRTPMNGILGLTYLMEDEASVEEMKKELPKLRESGEYLLQLINDVLDVNKVESGNIELLPKVCDEEQVFDSIIAMVKPLMDQKEIEFHFEKINIEWTYMKLDVQRVKQIFINVLSNAAKFTPKGGRIDFIMELVSEDAHMIRDKFIIRDNGIGISEEFLPKVFKPFAQEGRIHEDLGGTGLGLSIVKNLVELMDGSIEVKSKINEGTEFTIYLNFPLADKPKETQSAACCNESRKIMSDRIAGLNVLLCEDHPINAEITTRLLEKKQAVVTWKENGKLGVEEYERSQAGFYDVILMDIRMPVMDGLEAAKAIRSLDREDAKKIPIVAMTANAYDKDIQKSMDAGINVHLTKPINPTLMYQTIEELCFER